MYLSPSLPMHKSTVGAPTPPSRVSVVFSYQRGNFSITLSWESGEDEVVDEYRIHTNTTPQYLTTTSRSVALEAKYNIPLEIRVSAINCAGSSPEVTQEVSVGEYFSFERLKSFSLHQLAVVLPVHQSMALLVSSPVPE